MKQQLDTAGVAQVEATVLALPLHELQQETALLRQNLRSWMQRYFELGPSALRQLEEMPEPFQKDLAEAIASTWENGGMVAFSKTGEKSEDDENENPKDIFFEDRRTNSWRVGMAESTTLIKLAIDIVYR